MKVMGLLFKNRLVYFMRIVRRFAISALNGPEKIKEKLIG